METVHVSGAIPPGKERGMTPEEAMRKKAENRPTVDRENRIIRKCDHVKSIGAIAVYVDTGCRKANMIKGMLVSSRRRCLECQEKK